MRAILPRGTEIVYDELVFPLQNDLYTTIKGDLTIKNMNKAIKNLRIQLWKSSGIWWQHIHFYKEDIKWEE